MAHSKKLMETKRKIGVIGLKGLPAFGGAATVGENIIEQLKDKFDFTVYSVSSHANGNIQHEGYKQITFKSFYIRKLNIFFYYLKSAFHSLALSNYDIIHLHHIDGAFILPLLRIKYKVICTSHAQPHVNEKWPAFVRFFFRLNEKIALLLSNELTAVSLQLTKIYQNNHWKRSISYIPNGVNIHRKITSIRIEHSRYILFAAGRIIPLKGLHVLLSAMYDQLKNVKLLIIGDLEQVQSYKSTIIQLSQGLDVCFIPIIKDKNLLLNYVKNADLFIFPSYSENMSIMLLEVALAGTPIVCSDIPANTDIFEGNEVLFFDTNNTSDLHAKIEYALSHKAEMSRRTEAAYKKLKELYDWASIAAQYENLYRKLMNNNT